MKKKLRFYSVLLALVLIVSVVNGLYETNYSSSSGEEDEELTLGPLPDEFVTVEEIEGGVRSTYKPLVTIEAKVFPNNYTNDKFLVSKVGDQACKVDMRVVRLGIPKDKLFSSTPYITSLCVLVPIFLLFVWLFVIIFQVIRSVSRSEVFVSHLARKLERAGILLVVIQLLCYAGSFIITQTLKQTLHLAYYEIKNVTTYDSTIFIITGLILMIVSQITLMGKDLKEEQELTI